MNKVSVRAAWGHLGFTCGLKTCISILWGDTTVLQTLTGKCLGPTAANPAYQWRIHFKIIRRYWTSGRYLPPQHPNPLFYSMHVLYT